MADFAGLWFLPVSAVLLGLLAFLRSRFLARERRALFTAVAALDRATEAGLAERTRWPRRRVRRGLAGLERRGFVERDGEGVRVKR
jgi:hypothetical protein